MTITFTASTIELVFAEPVVKLSIELNKIKMVKQKDNSVFLFFIDGSTTKIDYTDVTAPIYANVGQLYTDITGVLATFVSLSVDALDYTLVENPVHEVNQVLGTFYQVFDMEGYKSAAIQVLGSGGVTFTAYMTLSNDANDEDETDTRWEDATTDLFGVASVSNSGAIGFIETLRMPQKIMIKYVISGATNTADLWFRKY